ncbi:SRPBCC domain-containing protein [Roseomonas sp. NAR14]|uniref:SRPBCC domain-containing protein n=1 Tax=Roseomonas acroporae TaxID=2937791 RepID=A0A9X2BXK4_9PROT|nr:SRPBCC domain-containing protein [Roseomonas acroporae]MCK8785055.1 SRPBCC domain-containing protein [Roseomonas acroporae]
MPITVERLVAAPIEEVWRAFNDPADILAWDAAEAWRTTSASNDLRVGGRLELRIEPRQGGAGLGFGATYTDVRPMRLIAWRTDESRLVRVEFRQAEGGVLVHQTFEGEAGTSVEEQRRDWQSVLDRFAAHVEARPARAPDPAPPPGTA